MQAINKQCEPQEHAIWNLRSLMTGRLQQGKSGSCRSIRLSVVLAYAKPVRLFMLAMLWQLMILISIAPVIASDFARALGDTSDTGYRIISAQTVDRFGNTLIVGSYQKSYMTIDGATIYSAGRDDLYIVKLDKNGRLIWLKSFGGHGASLFARSIAADDTGNIAIGGYFRGTISPLEISSDSLESQANGFQIMQNGFVLQLDSDGGVVRARQLISQKGDNEISGLSFDPAGNVVVVGTYAGANLASPALAMQASTPNTPSLFAAKLDRKGEWMWAQDLGRSESPWHYYRSQEQNIATDQQGNIYIAAIGVDSSRLARAIQPDPDSLVQSSDISVYKLQGDGSLQWIKSIGGGKASIDLAGISTDRSGNIVVGGTSSGAISNILLPSIENIDNNANKKIAFVIKLDASGRALWGNSFGGTEMTSARASALAVDAMGNTILAGTFYGGNLTRPALSLMGQNTAFVLRINPAGQPDWGQTYSLPLINNIAADGANRFIFSGQIAAYDYGKLLRPALQVQRDDSVIVKQTMSDPALPLAPVNVSALPGDKQVSIHFQAANREPGELALTHLVNVQPGGQTLICPASPCVISELGNNTPYTFTVVSHNALGNSSPSQPVRATPASPAALGSPQVGIDVGFGSVTLYFQAPPPATDNSAGTLQGYQVVMSDGADVTFGLPATSSYSKVSRGAYTAELTRGYSGRETIKITGLNGNKTYRFTLGVTNTAGTVYGAPSAALTPHWAHNYPGAFIEAIAPDPQGAYYIAGHFTDDKLNLGSIVLTRKGKQDAFVARLDADGNVRMATNIGGSGASATATGITLTNAGEILLAGNFADANLDSPALVRLGPQDAFVIKLRSDGSFAWSQNYGGVKSTVAGARIAVAADGRIVLLGNFRDGDLARPQLERMGKKDTFLVQLDAQGATIMASNYGGVGASMTGAGITLDASGNAYLAGYFDDADLVKPAVKFAGKRTGFALKLDAQGRQLWAKRVGEDSNTSTTISGLALYAEHGLILSGNALITRFGIFPPSDRSEAMAIMLDRSEGKIQWTKRFSSSGNSGAQFNSVAVDQSGIYLAGVYQGYILANPSLSEAEYSEPFLVKLDGQGKLLWADEYSGRSWAPSYAMAIDRSGRLVAAGFGGGVSSPGSIFGQYIYAKSPSVVPTIESVKDGVGAIVITFKLPYGYWSEPIDDYLVTASPGGMTSRCAESPCVIKGLTNGTSYTFTVAASNSMGVGFASLPSMPVKPDIAYPPAIPQLTIKQTAGIATLRFTTPNSPRTTLTGYQLEIGGDEKGIVALDIKNSNATLNRLNISSKNMADGSNEINITGLAARGNYTLALVAINDAGSSRSETMTITNPEFPVLIKGNYFSDEQSVQAAIADGKGNLYVAVHFRGSYVQIGDKPIQGAGAYGGWNTNSVLIAKLDHQGKIIWHNIVYGLAIFNQSSSAFAYALALDAEGHLVVSGSWPTFGRNPDGAVWKYDPNGKMLWSRRLGGASTNTQMIAHTLDRDGNIYALGNFDSGNLDSPSIKRLGKKDMLAVKLDRNGNILWTRQFWGEYASVSPSSIAVDTAGKLWLAASFDGNLSMPDLKRKGHLDAFLLRLDSQGQIESVNQLANKTTETQVNSLAADDSGNILLAGNYAGLPPWEAIPDDQGRFGFVAKLGSNGILKWAKRIAPVAPDGFGSASLDSLVIDKLGYYFVGGQFYNGTLENFPIAALGKVDALALQLDSDGNIVWAGQFAEPGSKRNANAIALDQNRNIYLAGQIDNEGFITRLIVPPIRPAAPTVSSVILQADGSAVITFSPGKAGSSPTINYAVTVNAAESGTVCVRSPCTVNGAFNATQRFTLIANSLSGASAPSLPVTAQALQIPATPRLNVAASDAAATLSFETPRSEGTPLLGYELVVAAQDSVTLSLADTRIGTSSSAGPYVATIIATHDNTTAIAVTGLINDTHYRFSLAARNKIGSSQVVWSDDIIPVNTFTQVLGFSKGDVSTSIQAATQDKDGNVYIAGTISGDDASALDLGDIKLERISRAGKGASTRDGFVVKYDRNGTLIWARNFGGANAYVSLNGIAVDAAGNVALVGAVADGDLTTPAIQRIGAIDALVIKLDTTGRTLWAKNLGGGLPRGVSSSLLAKGGGEASAQGVAFNRAGELVMAGDFVATDFGIKGLDSGSLNDAFAARLSRDGELRWIKALSVNSTEARATAVTLDAEDNVFLAGMFQEIKSMTHVQSSSQNKMVLDMQRVSAKDALAARLDLNGNLLWAKNFGEANAKAEFHSIARDAKGYLLLAGSLTKTSTSTLGQLLSLPGAQKTMLYKLDSHGTTQWVRNYESTRTSRDDIVKAQSVVTNADGNIWLTGIYDAYSIFPLNLTSTGKQDIFTIEMDAFGTPQWVNHFGFADTRMNVSTILPLGSNGFFLAGDFHLEKAGILPSSKAGYLLKFSKASLAPSAPLIESAVAQANRALITFRTRSDGGQPINRYTVVSEPQGITAQCVQSPCIIDGLQSGMAYTFTVTASNEIGTGPRSAPSNQITVPGN